MSFFKSIKFQLTTLYLLVILLLIIVFSALSYVLLYYNLKQNFDNSLHIRTIAVRNSLTTLGSSIGPNDQLSEIVLLFNADQTLIQAFGPNITIEGLNEVVMQALMGEERYFNAKTIDGQEIRFFASPYTTATERYAILVGRSTSENNNILYSYIRILLISGGFLTLVAGLAGFMLANRVLKPVDKITRTAKEIGQKDLRRRITVYNSKDELSRLASTLNQMFERLELAFDRQRQFTADVSHELRNPLSVIKAETTLSLEEDRDKDDYRKSLDIVSSAANHMSALVDKLLFLARSDAGKEPLNFQDVNIKELLVELSSDVEILTRDKGLEYNLEPVEAVTIKGDRVKLKQLLINLLENAIKYTPAPGKINLSAVIKGKNLEVAVKDTGPDIPPEHLPYIFQRFYRVNKARSRSDGGVGLGLAIARSIAEAHRGSISVETMVNQGSTFKVLLPLTDIPHPK